MLNKGEQFCRDHPKFGNYHHRLLQTSLQCFLRESSSEERKLKFTFATSILAVVDLLKISAKCCVPSFVVIFPAKFVSTVLVFDKAAAT